MAKGFKERDGSFLLSTSALECRFLSFLRQISDFLDIRAFNLRE